MVFCPKQATVNLVLAVIGELILPPATPLAELFKSRFNSMHLICIPIFIISFCHFMSLPLIGKLILAVTPGARGHI